MGPFRDPLSPRHRVDRRRLAPVRLHRAIDDALERLRAGRMVAVVDAADRMDQAELMVAAEHITPEIVNFLVREARGVLSVHLTAERCEALWLHPMTWRRDSRFGTDFMVAVEARDGVTTGISAFDRARTIEVLADPAKGAEDLVRPGHIFPKRAVAGGVLERAGHTEAGVDLMQLAGLLPIAAACAVLDPAGEVSRGEELGRFCDHHGIPLIRIEHLVAYRQSFERPAATAA
jgi:3,4-dihydroxy 2-butanone 4-phosphate synthase/GTP cyclohydrolase II